MNSLSAKQFNLGTSIISGDTNNGLIINNINLTGVLTNSFYPLSGNPSGYILPSQTGSFITTGQTGAFGGGGGGTGNYYPSNSNPSGYTNSPSFSNLTWGTTTTWNCLSGVTEDKKILILTGNTTLSVTGLYNGWCGVLETIQSGISSSGYLLTLPSNTKVMNGGSGIATLTSTSGAIDFLGFIYDGTRLAVNIGNNFT